MSSLQESNATNSCHSNDVRRVISRWAQTNDKQDPSYPQLSDIKSHVVVRSWLTTEGAWKSVQRFACEFLCTTEVMKLGPRSTYGATKKLQSLKVNDFERLRKNRRPTDELLIALLLSLIELLCGGGGGSMSKQTAVNAFPTHGKPVPTSHRRSIVFNLRSFLQYIMREIRTRDNGTSVARGPHLKGKYHLCDLDEERRIILKSI